MNKRLSYSCPPVFGLYNKMRNIYTLSINRVVRVIRVKDQGYFTNKFTVNLVNICDSVPCQEFFFKLLDKASLLFHIPNISAFIKFLWRQSYNLIFHKPSSNSDLFTCYYKLYHIRKLISSHCAYIFRQFAEPPPESGARGFSFPGNCAMIAGGTRYFGGGL